MFGRVSIRDGDRFAADSSTADELFPFWRQLQVDEAAKDMHRAVAFRSEATGSILERLARSPQVAAGFSYASAVPSGFDVAVLLTLLSITFMVWGTGARGEEQAAPR